jgi:pantoate--beta-alanine ligase
MDIFHHSQALRQHLTAYRQHTIALVPTMGNLHRGHLTLVHQAKQRADKVVVSLFVNPLQFAAHEDLDTYPRTLDADQQALDAAGVDILFAPTVADLYPRPLSAQTQVLVPALSDRFCGASRPGHFTGVATVVCKLLNIVQPAIALFGRKDFQQLLIIQHMVADLALPVEIIGVDTVREPDGLALSSRNQYLNPAERDLAPLLFQQLLIIGEQLKQGHRHFVELQQTMTLALNKAGFVTDFVCIVDAVTLEPLQPSSTQAVILVAAQLGKARLIDNLLIEMPN